MPTLSAYLRQDWFGRCARLLLMPDTGAAGGGAGGGASTPAPTPVDEAGLEFLPGGELLRGGTVKEGALEEHDGLPQEWTAENASGEGEEEEKPEVLGEGAKADAGTPPEGEGVPAPALAKEGEAAKPVMTDWPEAAKAEYGKVEAELVKARGEKEALAAEVATLKTAAPVRVNAASRANPLGNVGSEAELAPHVALAREAQGWARRHLSAGGELPAALQAKLEGKKVEEITEARTLTGEEAAGMLDSAERMLGEIIPARQRYLQTERETGDWLAKEYPEYTDPKTEQGKLFQVFLAQFPQVKQLPRWKSVMASVVKGHMAFEAEAKERADKAAGKSPATPAPIAPVPPGNGKKAAAATTPAISKKKASRELSASMDESDLARVM